MHLMIYQENADNTVWEGMNTDSKRRLMTEESQAASSRTNHPEMKLEGFEVQLQIQVQCRRRTSLSVGILLYYSVEKKKKNQGKARLAGGISVQWALKVLIKAWRLKFTQEAKNTVCFCYTPGWEKQRPQWGVVMSFVPGRTRQYQIVSWEHLNLACFRRLVTTSVGSGWENPKKDYKVGQPLQSQILIVQSGERQTFLTWLAGQSLSRRKTYTNIPSVVVRSRQGKIPSRSRPTLEQ